MRFRLLFPRIDARRPGKGLRFLSCVILLGLALTTLSLAAKRFVMPHPTDATAFPAHDEHPLEKVSIAIDPYDTAQKSSIFNGRYLEHGLLPMLFIVSNSGTQPVVLDGINVQLVLRERSKLSPANEDDLYRRLSRTPQNDSGVSRFPLPIGPRGPKTGVSRRGEGRDGCGAFQAPRSSRAERNPAFSSLTSAKPRNPWPERICMSPACATAAATNYVFRYSARQIPGGKAVAGFGRCRGAFNRALKLEFGRGGPSVLAPNI